MASNRIATRYSKSLLDMAKANGNIEEIKADMDLVSQVCLENAELTQVLKSPIINANDKKSILNKVFKSTSKESQNFISFLVDKKREGELPSVATKFISAYDEMKGIAKVTVVSAVELSKETMATVERYIKGMVGKDEVETTNTIDPSIIGGIVIKHEDKLLDMSVSKELREIRKTLIYN